MDDQQPSPSSSLTTKQEEMDKIEDGEEDKKLQNEPKPDDENQVEIKSFIDDLPPEMLMKILKYLDVKSLKLYRLVNRRWNSISRDTVQLRKDVETIFNCHRFYGTQGDFKIAGKSKSLSMGNYISYFKSSKETPLYTRFRFDRVETWVFYNADWIEFISEFGTTVKSLKLIVEHSGIEDLVQLAARLRNLLLNQLPNLEEFGFYLCGFGPVVTPRHQPFFNFDRDAKTVELFPTSAAAAPQLPNLKVIYLYRHEISCYTGIASDLLRAAVNLQKIESFEELTPFSLDIENLPLLHSLGKLDCLQAASFNLNTEFLSQLTEQHSVPVGLKLKKLNLRVDLLYGNNWLDAAVFISNILTSSKDTLKNLEIQPLGFVLFGLRLPKFSKLTSLAVKRGTVENSAVFPSGLNLTKIFPVLQSLALKLPWANFFPNDEIVTCLPNLKSLEIVGRGMTQEDVAQISELCPNLKEFTIYHNSKGVPISNFSEVSNAIWTHLKQLETLDLRIYVESSTNDFPAVDSCFTGFSEEDCDTLYDLMVVEKLLTKWESRVQVSKPKFEPERKNPSILDLKGLRKVTVCLVLEKGNNQENSESALVKKSLVVSEKYAFQLIQNLTYKIEKISL